MSPEEMVRAAIQAHLAKGGKLAQLCFGVSEPGYQGSDRWCLDPEGEGCCGMGTVLLHAQPTIVGTWEGGLACKLGVDLAWVHGFIRGWDGNGGIRNDDPDGEGGAGYGVGKGLAAGFLGG